jgi:glycosyltransferase involved in cell wall biosynthesis
VALVRAVVVAEGSGNTGGTERTSFMIERSLTDRGWDVSIAAPKREPPRWVRRAGGAGLWSSRELLSRLPGGRIDLLVTCGEYGAFGPRQVPRIHVYHGTMVEHTLKGDLDQPFRERVRRVYGGGLAEALAGRGAVSVSVSESAAREVRRYYRVASAEVIPNGVDLELFRPRDRLEARRRFGLEEHGRYALFVGRTEARKGADLLLPSCRREGYELIVAGRSDLDGARTLGVLSPEATAWAYAAADCVLFPTRYEACSWVVLEALAAGTPLLTTRVGWMETFLRAMPEYRALSVWPDVDDLAAQLRRLPEFDTEPLTRAGREWMERHGSYEVFAARWAALAERVVRGVQRGPDADRGA